MTDFVVRRDDWADTRVAGTEPPADLGDGQVLLRVDRFALTSNNVTYAAAGDMLDYWGFFPAEEGWGRVPAMGFGDVIRSRHPGVAEGQRVFGFFPMSTHLRIDAGEVSGQSFVDAAPHRRKHAQAYRQYTRVDADPLYAREREDQIMLLRGLFLTSFLVDDLIADNDGFGAGTFVISSASSKTGLALAFLLSRRGAGRVVGLTSPRNTAFVEGLGSYDEVLRYDEVKSLAPDTPIVFVDHSGDGAVTNDLHHHFGERVRYSCIVGMTHLGAAPRSQDLPGAEPTFFFAPTQLGKRIREWGAAGFQERLGAGWRAFCDSTDAWLEVVRGAGADAVDRTWREVLEGRAEPSQGHVLSLWP